MNLETAVSSFKGVIQEEVETLEYVKEKLQSILEEIGESCTENDLRGIQEEAKALQFDSQEIILILRVMMKIKNELAYARFELRKALKTGLKVSECRKRVHWLENRLGRVLLKSKTAGKTMHTNEGKMVNFDKEAFKRHFSESYRRIRKTLHGYGIVPKELIKVATKAKSIIEKDAKKTLHATVSVDHLTTESEHSTEDQGEKEIEASPRVNVTGTVRWDAVDEYWHSDHHRLEKGYRLSEKDTTSWHSLPISYHDTFLETAQHPIFDVPVKEGSSIGDVADYQRKAFSKLLKKIKMMYMAFDEVCEEFAKTKKSRMLENSAGRKAPDVAEASHQLPKVPSAVKEKVSPYPPLPGTSAKYANTDVYPRLPQTWCSSNVKVQSFVHRKNNKESRPTLPASIARSGESAQPRVLDKKKTMKLTVQKVRAIARFRIGSKRSATIPLADRLKWNRILDLIGPSGIWSNNDTIAIDAIKCLGQLGWRKSPVITALVSKVETTKNCLIAFEGSKALLALGTWHPVAVGHLSSVLENGNVVLKHNVLEALSMAKEAQFVNKKDPDVENLSKILFSLVKCNNESLALDAALVLGHMCLVDDTVKKYLIYRLSDESSAVRCKVLCTLVKQTNTKEKVVIDAIFHQIRHAVSWKHRVIAADLLIFIGKRELLSLYDVDQVFSLLEEMLWNHPSRELRSKVASVLENLGLKGRARNLVFRRLEDVSENTRAHGVTAMASLGIKTKAQLRNLLDILELDPSVQVRIEVIRAISHLDCPDNGVIAALEEKQVGNGPLAKEATRALKLLRTSLKKKEPAI